MLREKKNQTGIFDNLNEGTGISLSEHLPATGWTVWNLVSGTANRFFSSPKHTYQLWGLPSLLIQWVLRFFLGVKQLRHNAVHWHPLLPRLRMDRSVPPLPCMPSWHGWNTFTLANAQLWHCLTRSSAIYTCASPLLWYWHQEVSMVLTCSSVGKQHKCRQTLCENTS